MNKNVFIGLGLSLISISSFASNHGMAEKICNVNGGTYRQYSSKSINIDYIKTAKGVVHYMTILDPSPVENENGIVSLEQDNGLFQQTIIDAVYNNKSLSLCLTSDGIISTVTVNA